MCFTSFLKHYFFKDFIYSFLEREGGRKRGRERSMCERHQLVASSTPPPWAPGLQSQHVPWLGIEPTTCRLQAGAQPTEPHHPGRMCFTLSPHTIILRKENNQWFKFIFIVISMLYKVKIQLFPGIHPICK